MTDALQAAALERAELQHYDPDALEQWAWALEPEQESAPGAAGGQPRGQAHAIEAAR